MRIVRSTIMERLCEGEYREYRIPGIVITDRSTILCCYEARMSDNNDWAKIDIVLARSIDGGKSFSKQIIVKGQPGSITTYNNPVLVSDGNLVHFIWHQDYCRAFYQVSRDDGITFSEPELVLCEVAL